MVLLNLIFDLLFDERKNGDNFVGAEMEWYPPTMDFHYEAYLKLFGRALVA